MKKVITFIAIALFAMSGMSVLAQEEFDFDNASDFYLIWLDEGTEVYYEITPRIVLDLRLNGEYGEGGVNNGERFLDVWSDTYSVDAVGDKGSLGQMGGYMSTTSKSAGWAGGGFALIPQPGSASKVDYTAITDDYRFHMAIKKKNTDACRISIGGGGNAEGKLDVGQRAQFIVGVGNKVYDDPALTNLTPDFAVDTWQIIDIPVSQLKDLGWNNRAPFSGAGEYYISYEHGSVANNNLCFDAVFFYKSSETGIANAQANDNNLKVVVTNQIVEVFNATAPIEVYDLAGIKVKTSNESVFGVNELNKGAYIIKSGNDVAKVLIK